MPKNKKISPLCLTGASVGMQAGLVSTVVTHFSSWAGERQENLPSPHRAAALGPDPAVTSLVRGVHT